MKKVKLLCGLAVLITVATQQVNAQSWNLNGNAGTTSTNYIGTVKPQEKVASKEDIKSFMLKVAAIELNQLGGKL